MILIQLLNNLPIGYMKTTEEMLVQMATQPAIIKLLSDPVEVSQYGAVENFDMKYINIDMVNNVKRALREHTIAKTKKKFAKKAMDLPKTMRRRSMGNISNKKGSDKKGSAPAKLKFRSKTVQSPKNVKKPKSLRVRSLPTKTKTKTYQTKKKSRSLPIELQKNGMEQTNQKINTQYNNNNSSGSKYVNYITILKDKNNAEA